MKVKSSLCLGRVIMTQAVFDSCRCSKVQRAAWAGIVWSITVTHKATIQQMRNLFLSKSILLWRCYGITQCDQTRIFNYKYDFCIHYASHQCLHCNVLEKTNMKSWKDLKIVKYSWKSYLFIYIDINDLVLVSVTLKS